VKHIFIIQSIDKFPSMWTFRAGMSMSTCQLWPPSDVRDIMGICKSQEIETCRFVLTRMGLVLRIVFEVFIVLP